MKILLFVASLFTFHFCFGQIKKPSSKIINSQSTKTIVKGLPNEALKDLLNTCSRSCLNGNQVLNGFAFRMFGLRWGSTSRDAAEQFINAQYNEWMRDKIFILFYGYTDWMQTNFLSLGVKPDNCKTLSEFLQENIDAIKERDNLYKDNQDNNSISFIVDEFPDESPEFKYGDFYSKFIADSIQYPETALKNNIGGKVIVRFIIDKNGDPANIEIKEGQDIGYGIPEEAIRLVELMKWKPGKKDQHLINVRAEKTIIFRPKRS